MQKGRVLRLRGFGVLDFLKKNSFLITVTLIFTVGFFIGIFTLDNFIGLKRYSENYVSDYISFRINSGFWSVFLNSFLKYCAMLFILFLLGTSLFGIIIAPTAILVKGIINGGISSYLYSQYALKGIAFNAVIFIPPTITFLIVLLIGTRESVKFSLKLSSLTLSKTFPFNLSEYFKNYTLKYLILMACALACALLDAIISNGFIKHFTL